MEVQLEERSAYLERNLCLSRMVCEGGDLLGNVGMQSIYQPIHILCRRQLQLVEEKSAQKRHELNDVMFLHNA